MNLARCVYLVHCKARKYLVYRQIRGMLVGNQSPPEVKVQRTLVLMDSWTHGLMVQSKSNANAMKHEQG